MSRAKQSKWNLSAFEVNASGRVAFDNAGPTEEYPEQGEDRQKALYPHANARN